MSWIEDVTKLYEHDMDDTRSASRQGVRRASFCGVPKGDDTAERDFAPSQVGTRPARTFLPRPETGRHRRDRFCPVPSRDTTGEGDLVPSRSGKQFITHNS